MVFDTAWSAPLPVIDKLLQILLCPLHINMEYIYADEDWGSRTGKIVYKNGNLFQVEYDDLSPEAKNIATELWGDWENEEE